jgi:hypothetical protein
MALGILLFFQLVVRAVKVSTGSKDHRCYAFVIDGQFVSVMTANEVLNNFCNFKSEGKTV